MQSIFSSKKQSAFEASIKKEGKIISKVLIIAPNRTAALAKLNAKYKGQKNITWHLYK